MSDSRASERGLPGLRGLSAKGSRGTQSTVLIEGPVLPTEQDEVEAEPLARPRLVRHTISLSDGHRVGLAVSGRGVPLVVVHGFSAEGFLYAQTLSRLVGMGYKVIAIDTAGHGGTHGLPRGGGAPQEYAALLGRTIAELGIRRAVLAGHSMGGRLVLELAVMEPERAIALLLLDAIVGDTWDRMVRVFRRAPFLLSGIGAALAVDSVSTLPVFREPRQALKLARLVVPTGTAHLRRPWRLLGPTVSILRSSPSGPLLDRLAESGVPLFAIHGDRDFAVPISTSRDAAARANGQLVVVKGGSHSWVLKDPETLPAIVYELLGGGLGAAQRMALLHAGIVPGDAGIEDVEAALYEPDAPVLELTPPQPDPGEAPQAPARRPRYDFEITTPR